MNDGENVVQVVLEIIGATMQVDAQPMGLGGGMPASGWRLCFLLSRRGGGRSRWFRRAGPRAASRAARLPGPRAAAGMPYESSAPPF